MKFDSELRTAEIENCRLTQYRLNVNKAAEKLANVLLDTISDEENHNIGMKETFCKFIRENFDLFICGESYYEEMLIELQQCMTSNFRQIFSLKKDNTSPEYL